MKGMDWKASSDKWKASKIKLVLGKIHRICCRIKARYDLRSSKIRS